MPVVTHDTISADAHAEMLNTFSQYLFESQEITLFLKYPESAISPIQDVVNIAT